MHDPVVDTRVEQGRRHVDHLRQRAEQGIERPPVAPQESAQQAGLLRWRRAGIQRFRRFQFTLVQALLQHERQLWRPPARQEVGSGCGAKAGCAGQDVCVAMRKHDNVAAPHTQQRLADDSRPATALGHHVELHHVLCPWHHGRGHHAGGGGFRHPRLGAFHVEVQHATQSHSAQQIR